MKKNETTSKKSINTLVKGIYRVNFSTLSGCITTFCGAMKTANAEEVAEVAELAKVKLPVARKLIAFCKDKKAVFHACKAILPNVDGVIIEFKAVKRDYLLKEKAELSFDRIDELKGSFVIGKAYKPYGVKEVIELLPTAPNLIEKSTDTCKSVYAPFAVECFKVNNVIRAVVDYIDYCEKNNLPLK